MPNVVVLDNKNHRTLRVKADASAQLGDSQRFVPVAISEFSQLAVHYPILLSKDANTGILYCGAMLGFDEGENLFLNEPALAGIYRPLNLQRGPFYVSGQELAIDLDSPRVDAYDGQPLFGEDGAPTAYLESMRALMSQLRPGLERSKIFVQSLLSHKLLEPMTLDLAFDDGTRRVIEGLYTINREALRLLDDAAVLELFRRGYLQLIYLLIASLKHIPQLARRKNERLLRGSEALKQRPA